MFSFDPKSRILKVQKIPESELELNLLEYQRESYNKYVTETVYNDMQYLVQAMRDSLQVSQVEAEFRVEDLYRGSYKREVKKQSPSYYPVYAKFTIDGATFPNWVEVFRIPAMDADGILNVDGERRVLLMQMVAAERVSYAADKQTVSVTTPKRNISLIFDGTKDVMVKYGANAKIPMHKLIRAYNAKERVYDDPSKLFTSAFILSAFATDSGATDEAVEDELDKLKVHATYSGDDYSLGKTRDALNEVLSLDRAHGRILSRKVGPYEAGHRVDEEVLRYVHKNRVNELYVKAVPDIVGYTMLISYIGRLIFLLRRIGSVVPYKVSVGFEAAHLFFTFLGIIFTKSGVDWVNVLFTLLFCAIVCMIYVIDDRFYLYVVVDDTDEEEK